VQQQRMKEQQQQEGRFNYSAHSSNSNNSDMLSHREEVYGRPSTCASVSASSVPLNSRQFHRVSLLSPSKEQQREGVRQRGRGRFNIISGE
jgi:hypothetical protein